MLESSVLYQTACVGVLLSLQGRREADERNRCGRLLGF